MVSLIYNLDVWEAQLPGQSGLDAKFQTSSQLFMQVYAVKITIQACCFSNSFNVQKVKKQVKKKSLERDSKTKFNVEGKNTLDFLS